MNPGLWAPASVVWKRQDHRYYMSRDQIQVLNEGGYVPRKQIIENEDKVACSEDHNKQDSIDQA